MEPQLIGMTADGMECIMQRCHKLHTAQESAEEKYEEFAIFLFYVTPHRVLRGRGVGTIAFHVSAFTGFPMHYIFPYLLYARFKIVWTVGEIPSQSRGMLVRDSMYMTRLSMKLFLTVQAIVR